MTENELVNILKSKLDLDVMYHEEHKEYFFEFYINEKFVTVWVLDLLKNEDIISNLKLNL